MTSKATLSDAFGGKTLPGGGKAFDLSVKNDLKEEAALVDEFMNPAAPPIQQDEKPMTLPEFDDENESENENNEAATFNWDGVEEIQLVKEENYALKEQVEEQKGELNDLHVLLEALEPIPGIDVDALMDVMHGTEVVDHDIRDVKIVTQAKKIKSVTVKLNRERGKVASLEDKLKTVSEEAQAALLAAKNEKKSIAETEDTTETPSTSRKIEELRSKLDKTNAELRRTQKALAKEIGDGVSIAQVLAEKPGWKGRSEKIMMLQARIKRLEQKKDVTATPSVDTRGIENLKAQKEVRHQKLELLERSNAKLKQEIENLSRKNDAAKSRIRVLEKEVNKGKSSVKTLLEKANNDDELIEALRQERQDIRHDMQVLKRSQGDNAAQFGSSTGQRSNLEATIRSQVQQLEHQQELIASLKRDASTKKAASQEPSTEIKRLKSELDQMRTRFQNLVLEKEDRIADLEEKLEETEQIRHGDESNDIQVRDLTEENEFLTVELQKLKKRYSKLLERLRD